MSEPRQIAIVTDYDGLVAACRARADALNISRDTIDEVAGLPKGYTSKALMIEPFGGKSATGGRLSSRNLGRVSLGPMLGALGIALVVVEDAEALAKVSGRMTKRNKSQVRCLNAKPLSIDAVEDFKTSYFRTLGAQGGRARIVRTDSLRRKQIAEAGARARWQKEAR